MGAGHIRGPPPFAIPRCITDRILMGSMSESEKPGQGLAIEALPKEGERNGHAQLYEDA